MKIKSFYKSNTERRDYYITAWDIYPKFVEKIKISKNDKILDAGCGEGKLTDYLGPIKIWGVDLDGESVKLARRKGKYVEVQKNELHKMSYKKRFFDKTVSVSVFQYLENPDLSFEKIKDVTKKEIIITVPNFNWFKLRAIFSSVWRERLKNALSYSHQTNRDFLVRFAKKYDLKVRIFYLSNRFGFIRNLFGNRLSSEVVGVFILT